MSQAADPWSAMMQVLDDLIANADEIREFLASRHPEEGGDPVYTPLERYLAVRDEAMKRVEEARRRMDAAPETERPGGWQDQMNVKVRRFLELEDVNRNDFERVMGYYGEKLKSNKQAQDTVTAYQQQFKTMLDMNVGSTFNQAQ